MDLILAIACALIAAASAPLFLAWMRRFRRFQHRQRSARSFAELEREYRQLEPWVTLLTMALLALIAYPLWLALESIYHGQLATLPKARFLLALPQVMWLLPALFVALFAAMLLLRYLLTRSLGRRRYAEFVEYNDRKFRIDSWRLFYYLGAVLLPLCLVLTFMAFDSYARIDDEGIAVNEFLGYGEKFYRFDEIEAIMHVGDEAAPRGQQGDFPHYVIRFRGGDDFDLYRSALGLDRDQQDAVIDYLQAVTDLRVVRADPESV